MSFVSTVFDAESNKSAPKKAEKKAKPALKKIVEAVKEAIVPDEEAKEEE